MGSRGIFSPNSEEFLQRQSFLFFCRLEHRHLGIFWTFVNESGMQIMLSLPPAFFLWHTTVFWWVSASISWPTAFTDMWDNVVWSPWPSCYLFVSTEVRASMQWLRWPLTVFCPCARLDRGSVWIWKLKSHTQEPVGSHLTENIISLQSCWCHRTQMFSLLEGLWERQENWIQPGAKIREPQGTDFSLTMLSPSWSHKTPYLNSEGSCSEGTKSLWEIPGLMTALTFPNLPHPQITVCWSGTFTCCSKHEDFSSVMFLSHVVFAINCIIAT